MFKSLSVTLTEGISFRHGCENITFINKFCVQFSDLIVKLHIKLAIFEEVHVMTLIRHLSY